MLDLYAAFVRSFTVCSIAQHISSHCERINPNVHVCRRHVSRYGEKLNLEEGREDSVAEKRWHINCCRASLLRSLQFIVLQETVNRLSILLNIFSCEMIRRYNKLRDERDSLRGLRIAQAFSCDSTLTVFVSHTEKRLYQSVWNNVITKRNALIMRVPFGGFSPRKRRKRRLFT